MKNHDLLRGKNTDQSKILFIRDRFFFYELLMRNADKKKGAKFSFKFQRKPDPFFTPGLDIMKECVLK
jgi:hypothetical protein